MGPKKIGAAGFEPTTPCAQGRCATRLRYAPNGDNGIRTHDPRRAKAVLSR